MAGAKVTWTGSRTFIGTDSTNHSVVISSKDDGVGMKPNELLLVSLASCSGYDVVEILQKKRLELKGLEISVEAEQLKENPWPFILIKVHYTITGRGISEKDAEQAIHLSEEKYCSVAATIRGVATIESSFSIIEA